MHTIIADPITRISGLFRIEVFIEDNKIVDVNCTGNMTKSFQRILKGRSPLDILHLKAQICGDCSTAHTFTASLAVENALNIKVDRNSEIVRNFLHGCEFLQNHIRHFYIFTLPDYVKESRLNAEYNKELKDCRLPCYINERMANHYTEGLKYSSLAHQILALIGGKPSYNNGIYAGGATVNLNTSQFIWVKAMLDKITKFVESIMFEDVNYISQYYSNYFQNGVTGLNFLSYGVFDEYIGTSSYYLSPLVMIDGVIKEFDEEEISEKAYYPRFDGVSSGDLEKYERYSFTPREIVCDKASKIENRERKEDGTFIIVPRYNEEVMEVGPLARMILSRSYKRGNSTMDRIIARVLECSKICSIMQQLLNMMEFTSSGERQHEIPDRAYGRALKDTSRGALAHFIAVENRKISGYDIIIPSMWNLGSRDISGRKGVLEKALIGTYIEDEQNPIEIGRIIKSFDPSVSIATHITTRQNEFEYKII